MILFSAKNQAFYDSKLQYRDAPTDLVEVPKGRHIELLNLVNSGHHLDHVFNVSEKRPTDFHTWDGAAWVDTRTAEQKRSDDLAAFPVLTKRQFNLYLYDNGLKPQVDALLAANPRAEIEFDSTDEVQRNSPTVEAMIALLGWTDEQVDQMWQQALTL